MGFELVGIVRDVLQHRAQILQIEKQQSVLVGNLENHVENAFLRVVQLGRLLELNDTQEGVLNMVFKIADENGLLLLDLKDLRAMLQYVADNADQFKTQYGNISAASAGAIQRSLLALESQGADKFFGEPALNLEDLIQTQDGKGTVNILAADKLMQKSPKVYATFLLWMLSELFENLPEIGDPEKPRLVFFFDEAHLLFAEIAPTVGQKIEQMVRLIRSKGVGVYFVSQNPLDIPDVVLGQLGNRVQHALRAFTPRDQKAVKAAAETFRQNPKLKVETVLTQLAVGEALVSMLDENGSPQIVERAKIVPPRSQVGAISADQRKEIIASSIIAGHYEKAIDRESAYEKLQARAGQKAQTADAPPVAASPPTPEGEKPSILAEALGTATAAFPTDNRTTRRTLRLTGDFNGKKCDARGQQLNRPANRSRNSGRNSRVAAAAEDSCRGARRGERLVWCWIRCLAQAPLQQAQSPDAFCAPGDLSCVLFTA